MEATQHIEEPGGPQHPAGAEADEEVVHATAAASQTPTALPTVLAGVGSAYGYLEIQPTSLDDDDLTTETTDPTDLHVPDSITEGNVGTAQAESA